MSEGSDKDSKNNKCSTCKNMVKVMIIIILAAAFVAMIVEGINIKDKINVFLNWVTIHPVEGPVVFTGIVVLTEVFMVPNVIMKIGAGFALKHAYKHTGKALLIGSITVCIGISIGQLILLGLGRFVCKD